MSKVMCMFCKSEIEGRCVKKSNKVHIKKKRLCNLYEDDDAKIQSIAERKLKFSKPKSYFRPDWYWDRKNFIKKMKKAEAEKAALNPSIFTGNKEHPLTGDLSRFFKSTVGEEESAENNSIKE